MKCIKCGAERQKYQLDEGGCRTAETLPQCRDAISAQLASMTKRVEEAEVWGQDTVCRLTNEKEAAEADLASMKKRVEELEQDYESSRKELYAQAVTADSAREAAEAKLATAQSELKVAQGAGEVSERTVCGIPSYNIGTCEEPWGHEGRMHSNGGDGFYARDYDEEHERRQQCLKHASFAALAAARKETP